MLQLSESSKRDVHVGGTHRARTNTPETAPTCMSSRMKSSICCQPVGARRIDAAATATAMLPPLGNIDFKLKSCNYVSVMHSEPSCLTYFAGPSEVALNKSDVEQDSKAHIDAVGVHQTLGVELKHVEKDVSCPYKADEEGSHEQGLRVELLADRDRGDEGLCYAVDREQWNVVAVCRENDAGLGVCPPGAGDDA